MPLGAIDDSDSGVTGPREFRSGSQSRRPRLGADRDARHRPAGHIAGRGGRLLSATRPERGRMGARSHSDTYRGFFGSDSAIKLGAEFQRTYVAGNGYHRIWVDRQGVGSGVQTRLGQMRTPPTPGLGEFEWGLGDWLGASRVVGSATRPWPKPPGEVRIGVGVGWAANRWVPESCRRLDQDDRCPCHAVARRSRSATPGGSPGRLHRLKNTSALRLLSLERFLRSGCIEVDLGDPLAVDVAQDDLSRMRA